MTPQLGKRKRGSPNAQPTSDDGEEDELSPNHEDIVRSIEKSRRVVGTVSPIHEEFDQAPDELSILQGSENISKRSFLNSPVNGNGTPMSVLAKKRVSSSDALQKTPIAGRIGAMSVTSRQSIPRRSKSADPGPNTPGILPSRPRPSATRFGAEFHTPRDEPVAEESEDELSPPHVNGTTPRIITTERPSQHIIEEEEMVDVDELSSPVQPTPVQKPSKAQTTARKPIQHSKSRPIVMDEEDASMAEAPAQPIKRGRPPKSSTVKEMEVKATPVGRRPEKMRPGPTIPNDEDEEIDELSPEINRTTQVNGKSKRQEKKVVEISDAEEQNEDEDELEEDGVPTPQPVVRRQPPEQPPRAKPSTEKPPHKRQKFSGPKHAISVMRIKGSTVRGITVADTTRTILEETIDHRLNRMVKKMQTSSSSSARKELRSEINLSLSFKESLDEKLLDLQDANDVLSINFRKLKLFKRDNVDLRRDILALQNNRQEIALEHDDIQATFEAEKDKVDTRNKLSANMFDIEAAIQSGREKARREGREDEGPEYPLSMLLESVGRNVGSFGGGLLDNVKKFNGVLEKAAGWLEGRA